MPNLTAARIRAATYNLAGPQQQVLYDGGNLPGFGLRLFPTGRKGWVLFYRTTGGTKRLMVLGTVEELSLPDARKLAASTLRDVRAGADPVAEKRERRQADTVADLAGEYLRRHVGKLRGADATRRRMARHVLPALGKRKLGEVGRADVARLLERLTDESGPVESNRVNSLIRHMWNWGRDVGLLPGGGENPAARMGRNQEQSRDRWVQADEMPHLLAAMDACPNASVRALLRLLLLTGCRVGELQPLTWRDVDLRRGEIALRATKNGKQRTVYLSAPAVAILREQGPAIGAAPVFPGEQPGKPLVNINRSWDAIRAMAWLATHPAEAERLREQAAADVAARSRHASRRADAVQARLVKLTAAAMKADDDVLTIHDLRRTVGSMMENVGERYGVIRAVLGHSAKTDVTEVYARVLPEQVRAALERHAGRLEAMRLAPPDDALGAVAG